MKISLSLFQPESCTEPPCGACCEHMGTPPGYAAGFPLKGTPLSWFSASEDGRRLRDMPEEIRAELRDYYHAMQRGEVEDRTRDVEGVLVPCLWLDPVAKVCKHHQWRPSVCREFEFGGEDCIAARKSIFAVGGA